MEIGSGLRHKDLKFPSSFLALFFILLKPVAPGEIRGLSFSFSGREGILPTRFDFYDLGFKLSNYIP